MKKTIYLTDDIEVLVASAGGVGTTFLMKAIQNYKVTNCPDNTDGYKHLPIPPLGGREDLKVLYIYGDPIMAALSLFRRQYHNTQSHCTQKFEKHKDIIPMDFTIEAYAKEGKDRLHLADHFHNWNRKYIQHDSLFVRYEDIQDSLEVISDFVNLPSGFIETFPPAKVRKSSTDNISEATLAELNTIYSELKYEQDQLSSTSFVPHPSKLKRLQSVVSPIYRRAYKHYLKRSMDASKTS